MESKKNIEKLPEFNKFCIGKIVNIESYKIYQIFASWRDNLESKEYSIVKEKIEASMEEHVQWINFSQNHLKNKLEDCIDFYKKVCLKKLDQSQKKEIGI